MPSPRECVRAWRTWAEIKELRPVPSGAVTLQLTHEEAKALANLDDCNALSWFDHYSSARDKIQEALDA